MNTAEKYFEEGNKFYDEQNYEQAIDCFQKAIELNPAYADAYKKSGNVYFDLQDYDKAIEYSKKTIELNPNDIETYLYIGRAYMLKYDDDKALECFKRAVELNPDDAYINYIIGLAYSDKQDYDTAIKYLQKATKLDPNHADSHFYLGIVYQKMQNFFEAIGCFQAVVDLNPNNAEAYFMLGANYVLWKNDYDSAISCYQNAIELNPYHADAYFHIGNAYAAKYNDDDKAFVFFRKALELKPDYADVYLNMGMAYGRKGGHDRAIKCCEKAIELNSNSNNPMYATAYNLVGNKYVNKQDYDKAQAYFEKAIELQPDFEDAYNNIAGLFFIKQDYDKAIEALQKTLKLNPDFAFVYYVMGDAYNNKQDFDNAIKYYLKSIKYFSKEENIPAFGDEDRVEKAYNSIGYIYEKRGDLKNACKYYRKSGKEEILEMLVHFDKDNREKVIEQNILNDLLNNDNHFKSTTTNVKNVKKYKAAYLQSIYIISFLYIDDKKEKEVAHYREKKILEKMLFREKGKDEVSKFRLSTISNTDSNDNTEGKVLMGYLFENGTIIDNNTNNQYQAFAACFTFNHDSLNQFRLYGKEKDKECTGVSIVFSGSFFEESAKLATSLQEKNIFRDITEWASKRTPELLKSFEHLKTPEKPYVKIIGKLRSTIDQCALFRCIYLDPKINKVVSLGCKEDFLLYREGKSNDRKEYNKKMGKLLENVSNELDKLKKQINGLDKNIVAQLLINLRYLTKHVAFRDERECRIVKIADVNDTEKVKTSENKKQKYLEYLKIGEYIKEIYFGPKATDMDVIQERLLNEGLKIECKKSENPFV